MKVILRVIGKTNARYLDTGIDIYTHRLGHYLPFALEVIPDIKKAGHLTTEQLKEKEGEAILKNLGTNDLLVLLDERGKSYTSQQFAQWMENRLGDSASKLIFQIGGAYGFSPDVYQRAQFQLTLSAMTFSHQMIRLFFVEQLYRAMTILKNEPYHNE